MSIFTRLGDIVGSNLNSLLEKAEDPEKMLKLMIREMEDTLVELKASCAGAMASCKSVKKEQDEALSKVGDWDSKASLAVEKGRDDLAREALYEKRAYSEKAEYLGNEVSEHDGIVDKYQEDIGKLEEKLESARNKLRSLVQRHLHAKGKIKAEHEIRKTNGSDVMIRFDKYEHRIEELEAEANLVNPAKAMSLSEEIEKLSHDDEIEKQLEALKGRSTTNV
tara:strand:- start:374 stop:1039 length:666 start_codon:yes stop_codon:yes gene_type:complete